jgi:hypothetical protein
MKHMVGMLTLLLMSGLNAGADELRLTDGTKLTGWFLGGTPSNVWFQTLDAPAKSFALEIVDALTLGPIRGTPIPDGPLDPRHPGWPSQPRPWVPTRVHPLGFPGETSRAPAAPSTPPGP